MVDSIGKGSALAREAMQAALDASKRAAARVHAPTGPESAGGADFSGKLESGLSQIDAKANVTENLTSDLLAGKIDDFHEIAVQLKSAELSFRFAMEIRNKLVDAYREIMRMQV